MDQSEVSESNSVSTTDTQTKPKRTPEEVQRMIRETLNMLERTRKSCQNTIEKSEQAKESCQQTLKNYDNFKNEFQEAMDKMVQNIATGMNIGKKIIEDTEKYGQSKLCEVKELLPKLKEIDHFVFLTGAGISVASGIKTYRGKGSCEGFEKDGVLYKNEEIARFDFLQSKPEIFWERYSDFFQIAQDAKFNVSHEYIAKVQNILEKNGKKFTLITQNIDNLHVEAYQNETKSGKSLKKSDEIRMNPCDSIFQIHGNVKLGRCLNNCTGKNELFKIDNKEIVKNKFKGIKCPFCKKENEGRPNVLYFDESYNEENFSIQTLSKRIDLQGNQEIEKMGRMCLVVIGTTLETNMAHQIVSKFIQNKQSVIEINRDQQIIKSGENSYTVLGDAEKIVPQICKEISKNVGKK